MNKSELTAAIAEKADLSKKEAAKAATALLMSCATALPRVKKCRS